MKEVRAVRCGGFTCAGGLTLQGHPWVTGQVYGGVWVGGVNEDV